MKNWGLTALSLLALGSMTSARATEVEMVIDVAGVERTVIITLDEGIAPKTSANFVELCGKGFYNGISFHRVIPNYIVQGGDPLTKNPDIKSKWGTGGAGYNIAAELGGKHIRGAVAASRLGDAKNPYKESSGSQFYVTLREVAPLDGQYTVFGMVTSGLEVFDEISGAPANDKHVPDASIKIISTKVIKPEPEPSPAPPTPDLTASEKMEMTKPAPTTPVAVAATTPPAPPSPDLTASKKMEMTKPVPTPVAVAATTPPAPPTPDLTASKKMEMTKPVPTSVAVAATTPPAPPTPDLTASKKMEMTKPTSTPVAVATTTPPAPSAEPDPLSATTPSRFTPQAEEKMPVNVDRGMPSMPRLQTNADKMVEATKKLTGREDGFVPMSAVGSENAAPATPAISPPTVPASVPAPSPMPAFPQEPEPQPSFPRGPEPIPLSTSEPDPLSSGIAPASSPGAPVPPTGEMPMETAAPKKPQKPAGPFGRFIRRIW